MRETINIFFEYINKKALNKRVVLFMAGVVFILSVFALYADAKADFLRVYFFDVGQGDATFIEFPGGRQVLIDGGPNSAVLEKLNSVMPFWDRSIDIIVATHADSDHIAGLISVLKYYDVGLILWNGIEGDTNTFKEWKDAALSEGAEILEAEYGMIIKINGSALFEILNPSKAGTVLSLDDKNPDQNDESVVARLIYGENTFLFTGDLERRGERNLILRGVNVYVDILKAGHHGSKTSSSEVFLEKANPKIAIISAGKNNYYGHPHPAILQRLEKYGIDIKRTDFLGDLLLTSNGYNYSIKNTNL